ncbi:MAG TPA: aminotransferase class V-fold PLP-dependent enzyme [Ilumatobacter sp.]
MSRLFPYAEAWGVCDGIPAEPMEDHEILGRLREVAAAEDQRWEHGKCSGTMYSGDRQHYAVLNEAFGYFSHVNTLQRDICPSMSHFEYEIIRATADLLNGRAVTALDPGQQVCGVIGAGGTESILNAVLGYRELARSKGIREPQMILPDTAHPAFLKGAHLFCLEVVVVPTDPVTTLVDPAAVRDAITDRTAVIVGSAGNYAYGTIDPIAELSDLAVEHGVGLHVDGCLGGWILPWGERLGYEIPVFDFRLPGVTSISADTHKYGYGPKGLSVLLWRDAEYRRHHYYVEPEWNGGLYASAALLGSRSGGVVAGTWAALRRLGEPGYRAKAAAIFETAFAMQAAVRSHPDLIVMGDPTFCFAFRSEAFDIYHVNDHMKRNGWRFNGLQRPPALHMCVTGPQTQPGVVEAFAADLAEAVAYASGRAAEAPRSGSMYGGAGAHLSADDRALAIDRISGFLDMVTDGPP